MQPYYNPYSGATFFGFFYHLALRLWAFLTGELSFDALVSDEIQILVLCGVAASTALLGCFLVLRRMTMLANALSHTILIGIVFAYLAAMGAAENFAEMDHAIDITAMLWASLIMGIITTFLTEFLNKHIGLQEDASIGIVFSTLFAIGVVLVTILTRSAHIGTEVVMGNVDALVLADCSMVYLTFILNLAFIVLLFKEFTVTTFDQGFSRAIGISPLFYNYFLMMLVSATVISAFRAVGVLMVLSFITGPALTARLLTHRLKTMLILAATIGIIASITGVAFSRHLLTVYDIPLATGGLVVCIIVFLFILTWFWKIFQTSQAKIFKKLRGGA